MKKFFKLLHVFILVYLACRRENKQKQSKYLVNELSREEYKKVEKEIIEMLVERKNM